MARAKKKGTTAPENDPKPNANRPTMVHKPKQNPADDKVAIRFSFSVGKSENIHIGVHRIILDHMVNSFETTIFDVHGNPIDMSKYPKGEMGIRESFAINESYSKTRKELSIGHFIKSRYSIPEMKQDSDFLTLLKNKKVQLNYHKWDLDTLELRSLGFIMRINPRHKNETAAEEEIGKYMDQNMHSVKFDLHFSTANSTDNKNSTIGYRFEVAKKDVPTTINIMNKVNSDPKAPFKFIAYKSKYENPEGFDNAINTQNAFINSQKVIPLVGINAKTMYTFGKDYKSLLTILNNKKQEQQLKFIDIVKTNKTKSHGRWNAIINNEDFDTSAEYLRKHILQFSNSHPEYKNKQYDADEASVQYTEYTDNKTSIVTFDQTFLDNLTPLELVTLPQIQSRPSINWGSDTSSVTEQKTTTNYKDKLMNNKTPANNTIDIDSNYTTISELSTQLEEQKILISNLQEKMEKMEHRTTR